MNVVGEPIGLSGMSTLLGFFHIYLSELQFRFVLVTVLIFCSVKRSLAMKARELKALALVHQKVLFLLMISEAFNGQIWYSLYVGQ